MTAKSTSIAKDIRLEVILKEYLTLAQGAGSKVDKLTNAFIKSIEAGYWRPGDRIPTEISLTEALPLSLGTVQTVLRRLTDEGIIERRRGRGSRIADLSDKGRDVWFLRFLDQNTGQRAEVGVASFEIGETDEQGPWSRFLEQGSGYIRIDRSFLVAGKLRVIGRLYLAAGRFRPLLDYDPTTFGKLHVRHVLQHRFNAPTLGVTHNIRVVRLEDDIASGLGLDHNSVGLEMEVFCRTFRDEPLFYQKFVIPPGPRWINIRSPES
jgi:DNA-binding GntR family transcriptional regulator